jgi:hypothetical protein
MEHEMKITFETNYVQVISNGEKNYHTAYELWSKTAEFCTKQKCYKVLGIANSKKIFSPNEAFDHAKLFQDLDIDNRFRIAWVELDEIAKETLYFIETVLMNRGLPGKVFNNIDEAKTWLLKEE